MSADRRRKAIERLTKRAQQRENAAQISAVTTRLQAEQAQAEHAGDVERLAALAGERTGGSAESFLAHRSHLNGVAQATQRSADERRRAESEAEAAQARLLARARERKTLERLDARDRIALATMAAKAAQRALDELALQRAVR